MFSFLWAPIAAPKIFWPVYLLGMIVLWKFAPPAVYFGISGLSAGFAIYLGFNIPSGGGHPSLGAAAAVCLLLTFCWTVASLYAVIGSLTTLFLL